MISQEAAIKLAIKALEEKRQRNYAVGYGAYESGVRPVVIEDENVSGVVFGTFESDHKEYIRHTEAIQQLMDLLEILEDEPVTVERQLEV